MTQLDAKKRTGLRAASEMLKTSGFQPLPSSCLAIETILPPGHCEAIANAIVQVLSEYHQRGAVIQNMVERMTQQESIMQQQALSLQSDTSLPPSPPKDENPTAKEIFVDKTEQQERSKLISDLEQAHEQISKLTTKNKLIQLQLKDFDERERLLKSEIRVLQEKSENDRKRTINSFHDIMKRYNRYQRNPDRSGMDSLIVDVITVYEEKIDSLKKEIADLQ
jgi:hypothetical protein